jgi:hypothetical protein
MTPEAHFVTLRSAFAVSTLFTEAVTCGASSATAVA